MIIKLNSALQFLLLILLLGDTLAQGPQCTQFNDGWRSSGNYYQIDICLNSCSTLNDMENLILQGCCKSICQDEVNYHLTKKTIFIVAISILVGILLICCLFGCFGLSIKKKYVLYQQNKKRQVVTSGMTPQQFDRYALEFSSIFQEQERKNWQLFFIIDDQTFYMQWFFFSLRKLQDFKYEMRIQGQDLYGMWNISGFFVNTDRGILSWGLKSYENAENNTLYFEKQSDIVHELIKNIKGDYEGIWYNRKIKGRQGICGIKFKGQKISHHEIIHNIDGAESQLHLSAENH